MKRNLKEFIVNQICYLFKLSVPDEYSCGIKIKIDNSIYAYVTFSKDEVNMYDNSFCYIFCIL